MLKSLTILTLGSLIEKNVSTIIKQNYDLFSVADNDK